ncbi:transposase [Bifidobacterium anseris]|nr:transposase [Bifidobacterium anseris]
MLAAPANRALMIGYHCHQRIIECYRMRDRAQGRAMMSSLIHALHQPGAIKGLPEFAVLSRTLWKRRADILAYFEHDHASNGPAEAINGRLETLRGIAMGFRKPANYIARSLLHSGGFKQHILTHIQQTTHT